MSRNTNDTYRITRTRSLGDALGSLRFLGSCGCGCGYQFASTHEIVHELERLRDGRLVDWLTCRRVCGERLAG